MSQYIDFHVKNYIKHVKGFLILQYIYLKMYVVYHNIIALYILLYIVSSYIYDNALYHTTILVNKWMSSSYWYDIEPNYYVR